MYEHAPQIEEQQQYYAQVRPADSQGYNEASPAYGESNAYAEQAPYGQGNDQERLESQADIDDAWEAGYRASLGNGEERTRSRRGRKDHTRRGDVNVSSQDAGGVRESSRADVGSPSRSWNIVGVPSASQHISGPLSSSRHYVPMVPLEEIAAMPVPQGYPDDMPMYAAARRRPQQFVAGMSRLTFNLLLLGLVLCILAVSAFIGIQRLPSLWRGAHDGSPKDRHTDTSARSRLLRLPE
jgi:hypothetical protein